MNEDKKKAVVRDVDMQEEYDFKGGVRGKYAKRYAEGTNLIVLDPDIAEKFPNSEAVNKALRTLLRITRHEKQSDIPS